MSKRSKEGRQKPTVFDRARNELFSQIKHCGVLEATADQRDVWFIETMAYLAKRYPGVTTDELSNLDELGRRFCEPVIAYGGQAEPVTEGSN